MMRSKVITSVILAVVIFISGLAYSVAAPAQNQVIIAVPNDIVSLDPHATSDFVTNQILTGTVYETLVKVGTKGEYEPALAVSWRILDNSTWEFKLQPNVKFHNGESLTAEAIKFSLDRCLTVANKCPRRGQLEVIHNVQVVDSMTVRISTVTSFAALPSALLFGFIVPPRAVQSDPRALEKQAIGTGPMRLVEWQRGQRAVFDRFPEYWGKKPSIDGITYRPIPDEIARIAALQAGEVHMVTAMPPDMAPVLQRNPKTALLRRGARQIYVGLDATGVNHKATADTRVRQAMNYAVNKDVLIQKILLGNAESNIGGMFPQAPGFDTNLKPYPHDPERARKLLADAGYPNGFEIPFHFVPGIEGSMKTKEVVETLASDLAKVGIKVHLQQMEAGAFWDLYHGKKLTMFVLTWGTSPEAGLYYRTLLHSKTRGYYYRNLKTDELIDSWFAALDQQKRVDLGRQLQRHVNEQAPYIFLYNQYALFGGRANLEWVERPTEVIFAYDLSWKQ